MPKYVSLLCKGHLRSRVIVLLENEEIGWNVDLGPASLESCAEYNCPYLGFFRLTIEVDED